MYNCTLSACQQNDENCRETEGTGNNGDCKSLHQKEASVWQLKKLAHQKKKQSTGIEKKMPVNRGGILHFL